MLASRKMCVQTVSIAQDRFEETYTKLSDLVLSTELLHHDLLTPVLAQDSDTPYYLCDLGQVTYNH